MTIQQSHKVEADTLYEQFGKPLEADHWGDYVAISNDGRTILATTVLGVMEQARTEFGPGSFVFKVGQRTVGRWR